MNSELLRITEKNGELFLITQDGYKFKLKTIDNVVHYLFEEEYLRLDEFIEEYRK